MKRRTASDGSQLFSRSKPTYPGAQIGSRCPKCHDTYGPLQIGAHRALCNGHSKIMKTSRPGRVATPSYSVSGAVYRRGLAQEAEFRKEIEAVKAMGKRKRRKKK